jgi:DNA polymerase III epsilon subunit-like protein
MTYLFFDTETTGLPSSFDAHASDFANWPRIVQLAWSLRRADGSPISSCSSIILPEGFVIPEAASRIHGITTYRALAEGEPLHLVLEAFAVAIGDADFLVAHNYDFDAPICGAEFLRRGYHNHVATKPALCTQKQTTTWARIPRRRLTFSKKIANFFGANHTEQRGYGNYKHPSLAQLHDLCGFGEIANAHDASADVDATANCFFHILNAAPEVFSQPYRK